MKYTMKYTDRELVCVVCWKKYVGHFNSKYCADCVPKNNRRVTRVENDHENIYFRTCEFCGKNFTWSHGSRKYCSEKCLREANKVYQKIYSKEYRDSNSPKQKICSICGKPHRTNIKFNYCQECMKKISIFEKDTSKKHK